MQFSMRAGGAFCTFCVKNVEPSIDSTAAAPGMNLRVNSRSQLEFSRTFSRALSFKYSVILFYLNVFIQFIIFAVKYKLYQLLHDKIYFAPVQLLNMFCVSENNANKLFLDCSQYMSYVGVSQHYSSNKCNDCSGFKKHYNQHCKKK